MMDQLPLPIPDLPAQELPRIPERTIDGVDVPLPHCAHCDCETERDELAPVSDATGLHCPDCRHVCEQCGTVFADEGEVMGVGRDNGRRYEISEDACRACRFECDDCHEYFQGEPEAENADGGGICRRCAEHYRTCDSCDTIVHEEDSFYHEDTERTLCERCYNRVDDEDEESYPHNCRIRNYGYKPPTQFFPAVGARMPYFGVEIETVHPDNSRNSEHSAALACAGFATRPEFYFKYDGSVGEAGCEIVSHPATLDYWLSTSLAPFIALADAGYRAYGSTCAGMHVHVSRRALSTSGIAKLIRFCRQNQSFILFVSRRRHRAALDEWARPAMPFDACGRAIKGNIHSDRYWAINLENEDTVEFRIFRGTLNPESIRRNIAFVAALVAWARVASCGALTWLRFVQWIERDGGKFIGRSVAVDLSEFLAQYNGGVCPTQRHEDNLALASA